MYTTRETTVQSSGMSDQPDTSAGHSHQSIGVRELRAALAAHLARVEAGETLVISRAGRPVARLAPLAEPPGGDAGYGLEDMARLGLVERPRSETSPGSMADPDSRAAVTRPLPVDIRVDRVVRQVRG